MLAKYTAYAVVYFMLCGLALADTHAAASCSSSDIQMAVTASADGDTVTVPSGECTWLGGVTVPNTKGIILQGNGASSTKISLNGYTLAMQTSSAMRPITITGFTLIHSNTTVSVMITGTAQDWRIHDNTFDLANVSGGYSLRIGDGSANTDSFTYGLIDHNQFIHGNFSTFIFVEWSRGNSDALYPGDYVWGLSAERGTAQAVYVENNSFDSSGNAASQVIDARWGSKYVLRYNTIQDPWISTHSGCTNYGRNPIWQEIYNNTFTDDANRYGGNQIEMRSTSGLWFGNTFSSSANKYTIGIDNERSYREDCGVPSYNYTCDGSRAFDENTGGGSGYRCLGQPGWGQPQATDMTAYTFSGVFAWENRNVGSLVDMSIANNNGSTSTHLQFGRELFNQSDMTIGLIANRPSTCSVGPPRSVYISTNENALGETLYICTAMNTWTKHWEPFIYPHPLQGYVSAGYSLQTSGRVVSGGGVK